MKRKKSKTNMTVHIEKAILELVRNHYSFNPCGFNPISIIKMLKYFHNKQVHYVSRLIPNRLMLIYIVEVQYVWQYTIIFTKWLFTVTLSSLSAYSQILFFQNVCWHIYFLFPWNINILVQRGLFQNFFQIILCNRMDLNFEISNPKGRTFQKSNPYCCRWAFEIETSQG